MKPVDAVMTAELKPKPFDRSITFIIVIENDYLIRDREVVPYGEGPGGRFRLTGLHSRPRKRMIWMQVEPFYRLQHCGLAEVHISRIKVTVLSRHGREMPCFVE